MTTSELLNLYPVATEVVRDWFMDKMAESFKSQDLPKDFKDFMRTQAIPNDRLVNLIDVNPRVLLDVFDDNDVIINVIHSEQGFSWGVNDLKSVLYIDVEVYSSRKKAEYAAVQYAFQVLNNKLNVTLTEDVQDA